MRLAISPSGTKLAIVEARSTRVIDVQREVTLHQSSAPAREPRQVIFVDHERALLIVSQVNLNKEAYLYSLEDGTQTYLSNVEYAEADPSGERVLLRTESDKTTCLVKRKDLRLRRKIFWDCRDGFATFLPSGELMRSRDNRLEIEGEPLDLDRSVDTGAIWPDPSGERVFVFSRRSWESDPGGAASRLTLQEVDLLSGKVSSHSLPEVFSSPGLQEVLRGSVLFWLPPVSPWSEQSRSVSWLQFYDLSAGVIRSFSDEPVPFEDAAVSPSGEFLYVASQRAVLRYRVSTAEVVPHKPLGHSNPIQELLFSEDNQFLISRDGESVIIWDLATQQLKHELSTGTSTMGVLAGHLLLSTRDELIAVRLDDGSEAWRRKTRKHAWRFLPKSETEMTVWLESTSTSASLGEPSALVVDIASGAAQSLSISPALKTAAKGYQSNWQTAHGDKVVWSSGQKVAITNPQKTSFSAQPIEALRLLWLFGGRLAAAITSDEKVVLLDGESAKVVGATGRQPCGLLCKVEASPTQRQLVVENKGILRLWDASQQKLLWELRGGYAPAFSPDGKWLAVARPSGEIVLYPMGSP